MEETFPKRSNGRREADKERCGMCDFYGEKNTACFETIKRTVRDESKKNDHRFELFEQRLHTYMTKWTVGVIMLLCSAILGGLLTIGLWQLQSVHESITGINMGILLLNKSVTTIAVKQEGDLVRLKEIIPEHKELMDHMEDEKTIMD